MTGETPNPPGMSVGEAKARLLEFGERASREWHETIETMQDRARHAAPWAAMAAAGLGFAFGRRRKRRRRDEAGRGDDGPRGGTFAVWALKTLGPIALDLLTRKRSGPPAEPRPRAQPQPPAE